MTPLFRNANIPTHLVAFTKTYAVDKETSYVRGVRDISKLGVAPYLGHPETEIYLVSICGPDVNYVGPLENAPWAIIDGHHWVSHNAGFDGAALLEAKRRGQVAMDIAPCEWDCTANMAVFLGAGRSLAAAAMGLLGVAVDKSTRDQMNGKQWSQMSPAFQEQVKAYAATDAVLCYRLWMEHSHKWPEHERELSRHTMLMCLRGIATDLPTIEAHLIILEKLIWNCTNRIPWFGEVNVKGKEISTTSHLALKAECVKQGIPPPITTADKSPLYDAWLDKYEDRVDFVKAVKEFRSLDRTRQILKKFVAQTRDNGRMSYSLKYYGAHTGRWSGDAGVNFHNFSKKPIWVDIEGKRTMDEEKAAVTIDMRGGLIPGPGKKFIVADLSQIEARVALWFADDQVQLDLIRSGLDLYEAHARSQMGYKFSQSLKDFCKAATNDKDKNIRQFAKCRVLGLGFGLGFKKFVLIVMQWAGIKITEAEAQRIVDDYRAANPGIVGKWRQLDRAIRQHAHRKDKQPFMIELPNGRLLWYFNVTASSGDGVKASDELGGPQKHVYGGLLFENLVQATARDILAEAILRIEAAGYPVLLHAHDEVITEVDLDVPVSAVADLMVQVPEWAVGLPIACDAKEAMRYFKD